MRERERAVMGVEKRVGKGSLKGVVCREGRVKGRECTAVECWRWGRGGQGRDLKRIKKGIGKEKRLLGKGSEGQTVILDRLSA